MVEPIIGLIFILAPLDPRLRSQLREDVSIVVGVMILLSGMSTRWRLSVVKLIPLRVQHMTDVLIGIVCLVAPFVLGFSDETAPIVSSWS